MTLDDLRALADDFFEWPEDSGGKMVTPASALLFAKHVLQLREKSLGAQNSASTPTLRDTAQQALEALEYDNPAGRTATITALKAALAEPEPRNQCAETCERAKLCAVCARGLAEPAQKPVAWMCPDDPERETAFHWQAGHCDNCGKQRIPLYTAPPQRKPLTDAEIVEAVRGADLDWQAGWTLDEHEPNRFTTLARAIEHAHGIGEEE